MHDGNDAGRWINQLSHQIKRRMNQRLASMGVTGVQGRMLHYIIAHYPDGPVFQKDLEEVFQLRRSTATGILQLLEKNGLIRREAVAYDARLKSLVPTERAGAVDEEMHTCIRETEALLARDIAPEDWAVFLRVMEKMAENLGS